MDVIKVKRDITGGEKYLKNALTYVHDKNGEIPLSLSGNGVNPASPQSMYEQMRDVKEYFGKTSGNQLVHMIVSYDKSVQDAETACRYTEEIAKYFANDFQTVQCTHYENQGNSLYHAHIVANSVSYTNGMMFNSSPQNILQFCDYVHNVTGNPTWLSFEAINKKM